MWVARSLPPLLSRLRRPVSAHGHPLLLLGGTTRAYASAAAGKLHGDPVTPVSAETWPDKCNSCGAKQEQKRRHLYVVLDNWKDGFSLHKISSEDLVGGDDVGVEPQRLPDPILRFGSRSIGSNPGFHAMGSNIVVTTEDDDQTLTYDTETAGLRTGIKESPHEQRGFYHAVAAGNNLYTFDSDTNMLNLDDFDVPHWEGAPGFTASPFTPHKDSYVSACTLHPDGRTIFVSVRRRSGDYRTNFVEGEPEQEGDKKDPRARLRLGTFSLDTENELGSWTWHGGWCLPFEGQAHYDGDLGAWVGTTHAVRDGHGYRNDDHEHLCSYDPPDLKYEDEEEEEEEEEEGEEDEEEKEEKVESVPLPPPVPRWSLAPEKLTFLEPKLKSTGRAVLLHTGGRGTFCLVERALRKGVRSSRSIGDGDNYLLRVTMCRIRYGRDGKLVAAPLSPSRSYLTSRYVADFDMRAFWI